jgi:multidrug efflux pump
MIISDLAVKRPVFATVASLLLVAFGLLSFFNLPVREMPDVSPPNVSISTNYQGASAQVVESRITTIIEDQISGIEGIKSITSSSSDGVSRVNIEFSLSRDIDSAANDVRDSVSRVANRLPEEANPPRISKVNTGERAISWFTLSSETMDELQLSDYAIRNIQDRLSVLDGVARVQIGGNKRYAVRIWLDRHQLAARNLTVIDVERVLRQENVELPGGRVEGSTRDFTVRVERSYKTPEDFADMVLAQADDGHLIKLSEVARVELGPVDEKQMFHGNGKSTVGLGIVKQSTANTLSVAKAANEEIERIKKTLPQSLELRTSRDGSIFIKDAINEVYFTLFISIALVVFVIFLFLGNVRAALVPSITVPVCLVATFMLLDAFGFSINLLTLLALVLTIGLVVDDSIVVLENIHRRVEEGEPALLASYRGAKQVSFAVIATTLVLLGVFVPVLFLDGLAGRMFAEIALTLSAAVAFSSFVALTLSPMMCSKLLSRKTKRTWLNEKVDDIFVILWANYKAALKFSFNNKGPIFLALIGSFMVIGGLLGKIPSEFMPKEDRGGFFLIARGPEGASFEATVKEIVKIEDKLMKAVEDGRAATLLAIVPGFGGMTGHNSGFVVVRLPKYEDRTVSTDELLAWTRAEMKGITGLSAFVANFGSMGSSGSPIQFVVGGNSYEDIRHFRDLLVDKARANPMFVNVDADYRETKPQIQIQVDTKRAADLGVSVESIGKTLETMLGGRRVTTYEQRGEEYDVIMQAEKTDRATANDIENIYVRSGRTGQLVPLSNLVTMDTTADAGTLRRYNRIRAVTISASLAPGATMGEALAFLEEVVRDELPEVVSVDYKGDSREFQDSNSAIIFMFGLALLVVYLILAAQFESFVHPFTIMLTVPLAIAGGLLGLYLTGDTLNIYSQVGVVILIGLASKNGILIVEFANQLRDKGLEVEEAIFEACRTRLRPILMTGFSTAIGTMPLVLSTGPGSVSRSSIGIVIVSGVIFATIFTLFVIPVFYRLLAPYTSSPGTIERLLSGQHSRHPDAAKDENLPAE